MGKFKHKDHSSILGHKNGMLIISEIIYPLKGNCTCIIICDCGVKKEMRISNAIRSYSCGCKKNNLANYKLSHGEHKSVEYYTWLNIKARCFNPKSTSYHNYGARGILVCDRWANSYQNFKEDMGVRPSKTHSIDRINVNGNYEPSNCVWATRKAQNENTRRSVYITFNGETKLLRDWMIKFNTTRQSFYYIIKKGNSAEQALLQLSKKLRT